MYLSDIEYMKKICFEYMNIKNIFFIFNSRWMTTNNGRSSGKFDKKKPKLDKS